MARRIKMSYNEKISHVKGSASAGLMEKVQIMKSQGKNIVSLAGGEPNFDTPEKIRQAAIKALNEGKTHYAVGPGIIKLRERIAKKLREENDIECNADQIIVTPGGKFAIYLAVRAMINAGDEVMILEPAWVSYGPIVEVSNGVPVYVSLISENDYKVTRDSLESAYSEKTRMLIINYPNNPTGKILSREEAEIIKDFALDHNVMILSDEIYERIIYDRQKSWSPASFKEISSHVITVNGFSKAVAMTGWRLGYLQAAPEVIQTIYKLYIHTVTGTSTFIQEAAVTALDCRDEIEEMRRIYEEHRNYFISELNKIPEIYAEKPDGAFYAWVRFETGGKDSFEIAENLLNRAGVVGVPGQAYGLQYEKYIRFSFAADMKTLKEVLERLKRYLGDRKR